jgi:hypothetical protein
MLARIYVILTRFLARKCVILASISDMLARKCVILASISDILAKIRAGAPGPAGPETGPVPAWTGTGRAGQAVGTSLFPSAQPIRLCARGGTWGSKKLAKKSALLAKIPAP